MPALLINIKIDSQEKFELFKATLADLIEIFDEHHIKIRGKLKRECCEYARHKLGNSTTFYQELQEADWVDATLSIIENVKSRSIFLYFEDHKLVGSPRQLKQVLDEFDKSELDYLCYSFFKASQLSHMNLLPLGAKKQKTLHKFLLDNRSLEVLSKVSPGYFTYSLMSVTSREYFRAVLMPKNPPVKFYSKLMTEVITRIFPFPRYRRIIHKLNNLLRFSGIHLCVYSPSSPFNIEGMWFEAPVEDKLSWKFGVLKKELFANYDDDNGAYGESLTKRGLYPFATGKTATVNDIKNLKHESIKIFLNKGAVYDCFYVSRAARINKPPLVEISIANGKVIVNYQNEANLLAKNSVGIYYSNLQPIIKCLEPAEINLKIYDEAF